VVVQKEGAFGQAVVGGEHKAVVGGEHKALMTERSYSEETL
jgi:hypothetical protein